MDTGAYMTNQMDNQIEASKHHNDILINEKSEELISKFIYPQRKFGELAKTKVAKECAIICLDEIIATLKQLGEELYEKQGTDSYNARCLNHDKKQFWKYVKQEIEKL
jgi:ABC-type branched-subunit amino acid transport system ATPase component